MAAKSAALPAAKPAAKPTEKTAQLPDANGHFGRYGGRYVPEPLVPGVD